MIELHVYMSATLGEGGDLERLTGREKVHRLPVPDGFQLQGVGRRFFMFPGMSLEPNDCERLRIQLMKKAGRSVVLTPSQQASDQIARQVREQLGYDVFSADDIESSKGDFVKASSAVAVMAGRYDGIDFPMDECRLLCVDGLPRAMNAQERFLMSKMGALILFNERIQTRVMQAVGRCTRALQDYSAVYVTGAELQDYLVSGKRRKFFYPEIQAELEFGVEQSIGVAADDFIENFQMFLANDADWSQADEEIFAIASERERAVFPAMDELGDVVRQEVRYQKAMWQGDYSGAYGHAKEILGGLQHPELRGYRALWHYLAGSAARLAAAAGEPGLSSAARAQFGMAKRATTMLPWLVQLAKYGEADASSETVDPDLDDQIERFERVHCGLGTTHEAAFAKAEKTVLVGLASEEEFEQAHRHLGELLGFIAGKVETEGSPDPWWLGPTAGFVFEDHAGAASTSTLSVEKARQVAGHPNWMYQNISEAKGIELWPVLISPVSRTVSGALPHLKGVYFWPLDDFRTWANEAVAIIRELRSTLSDPGDLAWRAEAMEKLEQNGLTMSSLRERLKMSRASEKLLT